MLQKRYIKKLDMEISPLGLGIMRMPMEGGELALEAYDMIDFAIEQGINYFDTAYFYQSDKAESFLKKALTEKYPRENFIIADKMPTWLCNSRADMERIFYEQLERLGVEYIDIYLLHGLNEPRWQKIRDLGALNFIDELKEKGLIKKAGFSYHDSSHVFPCIVDSHDWDLVMLQINYYDWLIQDIKSCYDYAVGKNIPVAVMGPLGGGRLMELPPKAKKILEDFAPNATTASWGIRFTESLPNVAVTLSGMRSKQDIIDNISYFSPFTPYTDEEYAVVREAVREFQSSETIPCTACRYCIKPCPIKIDIPYILQSYNDYKLFDDFDKFKWIYSDLVAHARKADRCIKCGKCINICPQKIDVPKELLMIHEKAMSR